MSDGSSNKINSKKPEAEGENPSNPENKANKAQGIPGQALQQEKDSKTGPGRPGLNTDGLSADNLIELGWSHIESFRRFGRLEDIEEAVEYGSRAVYMTPVGDPNLPPRLEMLGASYDDRFRRLGKLEDMQRSIECFSRALSLAPEDQPHLPSRHANLGTSLHVRYQRLGEVGDLEESLEHMLCALSLTANDHPDLPRRHASLGVSYGARFQRLGEISDLEQAIEHKSRALALTPSGHPDLADRHASLGVSYGDRFERLGELVDLSRAIEHDTCALKLTPGGHPSLSSRHANLGVSYTDRFRRLGELPDLERAIEHDSSALALTPDGHPNLSHRHASLGVSYTDRFQRLGELPDLEQAIKHKSRALALTPDGHPKLSHRHASLGVSYTERFERLGDLADLEQAIKHFSRALTLTPDGHPHLPDRYAFLGISYGDRFRRLGDLADLEQAIEHKSRALALTPIDHPDLADRHLTLGVSYSDRFRRLDELADLEKATEHYSRALSFTPEDHPDLALRHFNQAITCVSQYGRTSSPSSLQQSLHHFRKASQGSSGTPRLKFGFASEWARLARIHPTLECIEAYQAAIDLLPQFIWLGAATKTRYQDLSNAESLAINAADAAIRHSNPPLALEWLEHARCVVWNQSLMLRSPLDKLHSSFPELATRLQIISATLYETSYEPAVPNDLSSSSSYSEEIGRERRRLALEYSNLLAETRTLPGFEDFLRPLKAGRIMCAAKLGPIVALNCHKDRCDALIVLPGHNQIKHLPLPGFTGENAKKARSDLETSLRRKGLRERGVKVRLPPRYKDSIIQVLLDLWDHVVKPVLDFLGYTNDVPSEKIPHITWCPTGPLTFLPLHAAGDYDQPRSRVFDYVISSYTPTLTALLASTPSTLTPTSSVLVVSQANTRNMAPLPGTAKELSCVKAHTQNTTQYAELKDDQATTTTVLDAMEQHDWVHLACHAHQNVEDPAKSGFYLHDGTLDLASINRRSFKNKGLAFLSACQTATGDEKLPDEAIHLASGMLMAGYPSVLATMWSVVDKDAPFVADTVYSELMKDGKVGNGEAGRALHLAVAALRDKIGEKEFARWVPYIHIGS